MLVKKKNRSKGINSSDCFKFVPLFQSFSNVLVAFVVVCYRCLIYCFMHRRRAYYYTALSKHFCCVVVELLQSLESKACEKLYKMPVSTESCGVSSAADTDGTDNGDKVQDEQELDGNVVKSASGTDDNDADADAGESIDDDAPVLCKHDFEAGSDTKLLQHSTAEKESQSIEMQATAQMNESEDAKSDSGHSSPCSPSTDGIDAEKTPGIRRIVVGQM